MAHGTNQTLVHRQLPPYKSRAAALNGNELEQRIESALDSIATELEQEDARILSDSVFLQKVQYKIATRCNLTIVSCTRYRIDDEARIVIVVFKGKLWEPHRLVRIHRTNPTTSWERDRRRPLGLYLAIRFTQSQ